jgi:hypothetical protein
MSDLAQRLVGYALQSSKISTVATFDTLFIGPSCVAEEVRRAGKGFLGY